MGGGTPYRKAGHRHCGGTLSRGLYRSWHHLQANVAGEHIHHLVAIMQPQKAVVYEHTGKLITDRLVQQGRRHGAVDTTRQAQPIPLKSQKMLYETSRFNL